MSDQAPLSPDQVFELQKLAAEQAFERERIQREERYNARHEFARQIHAERLQFERNFKEYGQLTLRSVFVLNAGSVVVLLAFIGSMLGRSSPISYHIAPALFAPAFARFACGLCLVVIASAVAYCNYQAQYWVLAQPVTLANNMMAENKEWPRAFSKTRLYFINATWVVSMACAIASVGCFVWGSYSVLGVFKGLTLTQATDAMTPSVALGPPSSEALVPVVHSAARWYAEADWWVAIATGLLWVFTALLWWTTRKAVSDSAETAKAATKAAVAATLSSNIAERALVELERPFLVIELSDPEPLEGSSARPGTVQFPFRTVELRLVNIGRMPAILTRIQYGYQPSPTGSIASALDPTTVGGRELPSGTVSAPGRPFRETENLLRPFSHEDNEAMETGGSSMWVVGFVRFDDIFSNHYITGFAQVYDRPGSHFVTRGDNRIFNYTRVEKAEDIPPKSS
jgi:hypothetical protein